MRADGGLMHQMLIGHIQENGLIPRGRQLLPPGYSIPPIATFTAEFEGLDPIMQLGEVLTCDCAAALRTHTLEWIFLEGSKKEFPIRLLARADQH
jgi:hypothetical protein